MNISKKGNVYNNFNDEQTASYNYPKIDENQLKPLPKPQPPAPPTQYFSSDFVQSQAFNNQAPMQANQNVPVVYYNQAPNVSRISNIQPQANQNSAIVYNIQPQVPISYEELEIGNRQSVDVICPSCGGRVATVVKHQIGVGTNFSALLLFLIGAPCCLCFAPYAVNQCKDAVHHCPLCDARIATSSFLC